MHGVNWFDADMCAAFGAVLYSLGAKLNTIQFTNMSSQIENILAKNGFLGHFGYQQISDNWGTTIPYRRLIAPFPGTAVNIEINSNDTASYKLAAEITTENIF